MATKIEVAKILAMLAATYPKFKLTSETTNAYAILLEDISADTLKAAAMQCATSGTFFPSVYELRQAVLELRSKIERIPSSYEAWQDVTSGPRSDIWKSVEEEDGKMYLLEHRRKWLHPVVERVAKMLGWPNTFPGDNPGVDRAHFFKAYEATVNEALSDINRLPAITAYVESKQTNLMEVSNGRLQITRITDQAESNRQ